MGLPFEPTWLAPAALRPEQCRRCGSPQIRSHAGSRLLWFACQACSYVWGRRQRGDEDRMLSESNRRL